MMEVTQNVELLSELPTDEKIVKSVVELNHKVEKLPISEIKSTATQNGNTNANALTLTSADDADPNYSFNGKELDVSSADENETIALNDSIEESSNATVEKSSTVSVGDRDMSSDLDALLHKISSIDESSLKRPIKPDETAEIAEPNSKVHQIEENNTTAAGVVLDTNDVEAKQSEDVQLTQHDSSSELHHAEIVETECEPPANDILDNSSDIQDELKISDSKPLNSSEEVKDDQFEGMLVDSNKINSDQEAKDNVSPVKSSQEDEFMDALETISSSSDEFEPFSGQDSKKIGKPFSKSIEALDESTNVKEKHINGLEAISSDESLDMDKNEKGDKSKKAITFIDLDSSEECLACDESEASRIPDEKTINTAYQDDKIISVDEVKPTETGSTESASIEKMNIDEPEPTQTEESSCEENSKTKVDHVKDPSNKENLLGAPTSCDILKEATQDADKSKNTEPESEVLVILDNDETNAHESSDLDLTKPDELGEDVRKNTDESVESKSKALKSVEPANVVINEKETGQKEQDSEDDEVIFFEPIEKAVENEATSPPVEKQKDETAEKKVDEVVLVSEDEDEELPATKPKEEEISNQNSGNKNTVETESLPTSSKTETKSEGAPDAKLLADNSDNACDQFDKTKSDEKLKPTSNDDINSNSSSNLLRPSKEPTPKTSTQATGDDGDIEMIGDETDAEHDSNMPPLKRPRLSQEEENTSNKSSNSSSAANVDDAEKQDDIREVPGTKRPHDLLASSPTADKEETPNKKIKTDDSDSNCSTDGQTQIDMKTEHVEKVTEIAPKNHPTDEKQDQKNKQEPDSEVNVEQQQPIELKPPPEIRSDVQQLRLEFVRNFRKSFDKMTRNDLEELVLQKVVEGMLVKSDFADIRRQVDKYEITLTNYRRKIAEVTKQFFDLETVHKRVLKDLETKNSQFTAPVRITRAVGLQVGMAVKKSSDETRTLGGAIIHTGVGMPAAAIGASPSLIVNASSTRSPLRGIVPSAASGATTRPGPQSGSSPIRGAAGVYTQATTNPAVRRGCMQKITPQRPVNNAPTNVQSPMNMQRVPTGPIQTGMQGKSMHVAKHVSGSSAAATVTMSVRSRAMPSTSPTKQPSYGTQKQQQGQAMYNLQRPKQFKTPPKAMTTVRPMPAGGTVSVPMSNASASHSAAAFGQPTLAPAKPKEKAVIDLTDEDDAAAAAAAEATSRLKQTSNVVIKRTVQTPTSGTVRPVAGSVVRVSPLNMPRANAVARQIVSSSSAGQRTTIGIVGSNVTMQIRSENTPPTSARLRYSHPAPLPSSPAQPFNPAWKLPPSRPVIRISLHDTGIVISWTLEDTSSRFANCVTYQIYAYQETIHEPSTDSWRHVGDVKAMLLPMAVTLNQFQENQRYYFAVRGVDDHQRYGAFSVPKTWS